MRVNHVHIVYGEGGEWGGGRFLYGEGKTMLVRHKGYPIVASRVLSILERIGIGIGIGIGISILYPCFPNVPVVPVHT
jgi:hypothetical protein